MPNGESTGMASKKKVKKQKLESKPKIRRRLFKLWHDKVMLLNGNKCAITGILNGSPLPDGKKAILDAHHIECKEINPALRFDALNGIALNKSSHKFGRDSFHKAPLWAAEWLRVNRPKQYAHVLAHRNDPIDLEDRDILYAIEAKLKTPPTAEDFAITNVLNVMIVEPTGTLGGPDGMEKSDTPPMPNKP